MSQRDGNHAGFPRRGTNQTAVKRHNERLVLSLVRQHRSLSKVEIARLTGLSLQASSVIAGQLERDGLLRAGTPQRGKVGHPTVPFSLDPDGAFSLGFKFGRRSADLALMDFVGNVRRVWRSRYAYPTPSGLERFLRQSLAEMRATADERQLRRIRGMGIAAPLELWSWEAEAGVPPEIVAAWRDFDLCSRVADLCPWPVRHCKDATAACAAELAFGKGTPYEDFLYIFVGTLVGGGLVIGGELFPGRSGYAGSIGSILIGGDGGRAQRLIGRASLYLLERMAVAAGKNPDVLWHSPQDWTSLGTVLDEWIDQATDALSLAIGSAIAVLDFQAVMIDGAVPEQVRARLIDRTRERFRAVGLQGVAPLDIVEGTVGADARMLGAASLPLLADVERERLPSAI